MRTTESSRWSAQRVASFAAAFAALVFPVNSSGAPTSGPSVYYQYDVIGKSGQAGLTGMGDNVSINDKGSVAFVGKIAGGESVFVGDGSVDPRNITTFVRTFGRAVRINNNNKVVARDSLAGAPPPSNIRVWNADAVDDFDTIARGGVLFQDYDSVFSHPSLNNSDQVVFSALDGSTTLLATPDFIGFNEAPLATPLRPLMADDGRVIVRSGNLVTDPIQLWSYALDSAESVGSGGSFSILGQSPGISDDAVVAAFFGNLDAGAAPGLGTTPGAGIFASVDEGGTRKIVRVAGLQVEDNSAAGGNDDGICDAGETCRAAAELGYTDAGSSLFFSAFEADSRVGVVRLDLGPAGIDGDTFLVTFIATPNAASRPNPALAGQDLFFSAQKGLWTVRVDVERQLGAPGGLVYHAHGPIPVVQINDTIDGRTVTGIAVFDPIGRASTDDVGTVRTERRGDHRVGFWASTGSGDMVVRATHLDSDQDGLLDHWETAGIDVDGDGALNLDLPALGALANQRDIFMEIDWLSDQIGHVHEPAPGVVSPLPAEAQSALEQMFGNAPALAGSTYGARSDGGAPAAIPAGITLHVDGGPSNDQSGQPFSINMGAAALQGGDKIGQPGSPGEHIDVVHFGLPGSLAVPGVSIRSFKNIKDTFFGTAEGFAREFAFHYVVFADSHSFLEDAAGNPYVSGVTASTNDCLDSANPLPIADLKGDVLKITAGTGAGQVREIFFSDAPTQQICVTPDWAVAPDATSTYALMNGSSGKAEGFFHPDPDFNSLPGSDLLITLRGFGVGAGGTLANACTQWRTLAHEFGHTLGLRHGGTNLDKSRGGAYLSLMSYDYQLLCGAPPSPVQSYSTVGDPIYDDFANLKLQFPLVSIHAGQTFGFGLGGVPEPEVEDPEPTIVDYEALNGPIDLVAPVVDISSPAGGTSISSGGSLSVAFTATDASFASAAASFDVNGDGDTSDAGESIPAALTGPNTFAATFSPVSGPDGPRTLRAFGLDAYDNLGVDLVSVNVGAGGGGVCGDGTVDAGEQCDDGNTAGGDGCSATCTSEVCGNGTVDAGEQCDDGNTAGGDGCSATCRNEVCGNGTLDPGEQCDDGNTAGGDGCSANCTVEFQPVCGNGALESGEECDDGNTASGDGCSAQCETEVPPVFDAPRCGTTVSVKPKATLAFDVQASDPDPADTVTLTANGLPPGATMDPALPATGNPVVSEFSWTPSNSDLHSEHTVTFLAEDTDGLTAPCSIRIQVETDLLVVMTSFTAEPSDRTVTLRWTTEVEVDNAGFYILRRNRITDEIARLTPGLLPAGGDLVAGAEYEFTDATPVNGVPYEYTLVDVDIAGLHNTGSALHAVANPTGPRVRLLSPEYGAEKSDGARWRFLWEHDSGLAVELQVSADPTFRQGPDTLAVPVQSAADRRGGLTLGSRRARILDRIARESGGNLFWRVVERAGDTAGESATFHVRVVAAGMSESPSPRRALPARARARGPAR